MPSLPQSSLPESSLLQAYAQVRAQTEALVAPFEIEDLVIQSMPDASPARWHLAHTTWFFETFVLLPHASRLGQRYTAFEPAFAYLFNSYYNGVGDQFPRERRGTQSRPTVARIRDWRAAVDAAMQALLASLSDEPVADEAAADEVRRVTTIGLHHEQQHQELMITDLTHALCTSGLPPSVIALPPQPTDAPQGGWAEFDDAFVQMGHAGDGFCFDNELPQHQAWVPGFAIARDLVTNAEYQAFIDAGGYAEPCHWMSDGWTAVQTHGWTAPLYWQRDGQSDAGQRWQHVTLAGVQPLAPHAPVCHLSWFEADAYARWAGKRLPTEFEWARAALSVDGAFAGNAAWSPDARPDAAPIRHLFGQVWQWTASAYRPYPGYQPLPGTLGEYNGKFMHGQLVLRGSSCATAAGHGRTSYRNFFPAHIRWQFSGLRLASDVFNSQPKGNE